MTTETTKEPDSDFYILAWGMVATSICTSLPVREATARLNREMPTGISSRWAKSKDRKFASGEPNPCPCETYPATHKHYLYNC